MICARIRRCADLAIVPTSFLDAPAEQGCRPARSAQSERPQRRPSGTELRNRELRCEETYCWPEGETSSVPALSLQWSRRGSGKSRARNRAVARGLKPGHPEQDYADVASRHLPMRNACRVKVGTVGAPASSAFIHAAALTHVEHRSEGSMVCVYWSLGCGGSAGPPASRSLLEAVS